jgi:hypothetical protein
MDGETPKKTIFNRFFHKQYFSLLSIPSKYCTSYSGALKHSVFVGVDATTFKAS